MQHFESFSDSHLGPLNHTGKSVPRPPCSTASWLRLAAVPVCVNLLHWRVHGYRFRDAGCEQLCAGLLLNERITTLSLNYCELDIDSGRLLADTIPNTCIMYATLTTSYTCTHI